jgi:multisubunit Na+/H+ antiporter MnhF subunit
MWATVTRDVRGRALRDGIIVVDFNDVTLIIIISLISFYLDAYVDWSSGDTATV